MINPTIFKSNDIRGIYPSELNEEAVYDIGRSFVKYTGAKKVVIARDSRLSGEALFNSLAKGIKHQGADVCDIGRAPTECLYYAVGNHDFDAGIMLTASHNPKEYNGLKMVKKNGNDIEVIRGKDLLSAIETDIPKEEAEVEINKKDIWKDYLIYILSYRIIKTMSIYSSILPIIIFSNFTIIVISFINHYIIIIPVFCYNYHIRNWIISSI